MFKVLMTSASCTSIGLYRYVIFNEESSPITTTSRKPPRQDLCEPGMPMEVEKESGADTRTLAMKRGGPETRTIVIGRERKIMVIETLHLRLLWWMLQGPILTNWDPLCFLEGIENDMHTSYQNQHDAVQHTEALFNFSFETPAFLHVDLREGHVFRVDQETGVLTEEGLAKHWRDFEAAEEAELRQFAQEKAFTKIHVSTIIDEIVVVDCTCVRLEKGHPNSNAQSGDNPSVERLETPSKDESISFAISKKELQEWLLLCVKPAYGLGDAPWQLNLHEHVLSRGGSQSVLDENLFSWKQGGLKALITTHPSKS